MNPIILPTSPYPISNVISSITDVRLFSSCMKLCLWIHFFSGLSFTSSMYSRGSSDFVILGCQVRFRNRLVDIHTSVPSTNLLLVLLTNFSFRFCGLVASKCVGSTKKFQTFPISHSTVNSWLNTFMQSQLFRWYRGLHDLQKCQLSLLTILLSRSLSIRLEKSACGRHS